MKINGATMKFLSESQIYIVFDAYILRSLDRPIS